MALRNQPYLPLYVQDFQTDEKLMECSASATGVYIRIMCVMHKSEHYGKILLKQKYKQNEQQVSNFASLLAKFLPYDLPVIEAALIELLSEKVLQIDGDLLVQKRMVKDGEISDKRALAGKEGGKKSLGKKNKKFAQAKSKAKPKANSENEIEYENEGGTVEGSRASEQLPEEKVQVPFETEKFIRAWATWKKFKAKEHKFYYKTVESEQAALVKLYDNSDGDEDTALEIINNSIANGWKGLFPPDEKNKNGKDRKTDYSRLKTASSAVVGAVESGKLR